MINHLKGPAGAFEQEVMVLSLRCDYFLHVSRNYPKTEFVLKLRQPRTFPARITISSALWIACTTWAIPGALRNMHSRKHAFQTVAGEGSVLLVEPHAGDRVEQNLHPIGRLFYAASTAFCTPNSLSQEVGTAPGAQAGESQLAEVMFQAGFRKFRRATETPFNLVFETRK
jgi:hypothetical protein